MTLTLRQRDAKNQIREYTRANHHDLFLRMQKASLHKAFHHLIDPNHEEYGARYNFFKGGRGGMRTTSIAKCFVDWMLEKKVYLVAARSFQNSINSSNKKAIQDAIEFMGLYHRFEIKRDEIEADTGSLCVFKGLERNPDSFMSLEGADVLWWEEAGAATLATLRKATPTIRKKGSRIIFSYNPELEDAPIESFRRENEGHKLGCVTRHTNYLDNPWCPEELKLDAEQLKSKDYEQYLWVFEGQYWSASEASILGRRLKGYAFDENVDGFDGPFLGIDWGYSQDPTAVTESYIKGNSLFIRRAAGRTKLELSDTGRWLIERVPNLKKYVSYADSARPETISHVGREIPLIRPVEKGKGSVEDGVVFLQSFDEIVVHPECQSDTLGELRAYSFKVDSNQNVTKVVSDKNNHYSDSLRYGLSPRIKSNTPSFGRHGIGYVRH